MNLMILDVIKFYTEMRSNPSQYMQGSPVYGVSKWVDPVFDIHMTHEKFEVWGPVERWGTLWRDSLTYYRVEIWHDEFLIELDIHHNTLEHYTQCLYRPRRNPFCENRYNLNWFGDPQIMQEWSIYQNLIHKVSS